MSSSSWFRWWPLGLCLLVLPALGQATQPGWFTDAKTGCKVWNAFPVSNEQVTWSGECIGGYAEGKGVMQWILAGKPTRKKYDGEMKKGHFDGKGTLIFTNGDTYEGQFRDSERNGQGKMTWYNRNTYDGEWKNGLMDGRGTYKWLGGNIYAGSWVKGKQEGRGKFTFLNGNSYEGEFKDSMINGRGRYRWSNGDVYDGSWENEEPNGIGTLKIYNTDELVTGNWVKGCLVQEDRMVALNKSEMECRLGVKPLPPPTPPPKKRI